MCIRMGLAPIMRLVALASLLTAAPGLAGQAPVGTSFSYQGLLRNAGVPVNDTCALRFSLFDASSGNGQVGPTLTFNGVGGNPPAVVVANGLFLVELNFGEDAFTGDERWLQIAAACPAGETLTNLIPRQELTPAPYALHAVTAPRDHALDAVDGDPVDAVFVDASGDVGVGTTSPQARLDVAGDGQIETLRITEGGGPLAGPVLGWGSNSDGQATPPAGDFIAVAAGGSHSIAIRSDGTLAGWGRNIDGEINVPAGTFIAVAAAGRHSLGLRTNGTLAAWGANDQGQTNVPAGMFVAIAAGSAHNMAIRPDGTIAGWGANNNGQLNIPAGTYTAVSGGNVHSVALRTDGTLVAWGTNTSGQTNVPAGTFIAVDAGAIHNIAIRSNGTLVGWGSNVSGQTNVPVGTFSAISAGAVHSLGIRTDGTLAGWGGNTDGQINVPAGSTFSAIAAGASHSLAIDADSIAANFGLLLTHDSAAKPGTNTWTIFSDRRLKKNIVPLNDALEKLLSLQGVWFEWNDSAAGGGHTGPQMGMIADQVQSVFPQWVGRDLRGYRTLTIGGFEALTAEAVRSLRAEKDRQLAQRDAEIGRLQATVTQAHEEISELQSRLNQLEATLGLLTARTEEQPR